MTETNPIFKPAGWRMTFKDSKDAVCCALLPDPGTTILIAKTGKEYSAMWVDPKGVLKTVGIVQVGDHWEVTAKHDRRSYVITVAVTPGVNGKPPSIGGNVKPATNSKTAPVRKPNGG